MTGVVPTKIITGTTIAKESYVVEYYEAIRIK